MWAPLRQRAFRWLWIGVLISWTGTWMQMVGRSGCWLTRQCGRIGLVRSGGDHAAGDAALALPGGVLADSFDRRWLLFTIQVYFFVVSVLLAVLTAAGQMPAASADRVHVLCSGSARPFNVPTWGATVPELVPRTQLRAASRLDLVSVSTCLRAVGPALARW